jgi:trimeric autotransporter adhesin
MKIPVPIIRTLVWKIFGTIVIFLLTNTRSFAATPANDACTNAVSLTPGATCSPTTGTLLSATNAAPTGGCGGATSTTTYDVWYKFKAAAIAQVISVSITGTNLTATTTYVEVFTGTCGSFISLVCQDASSPISVTGLTINTTYYVRVYVTTNPSTGSKGFNICVQNPPANDDCSNATTLTVGGATSTGTLVDATELNPVSLCSNSSSPDVWYKFSATSKYPIITLSTVGANLTTANSVMELYSGTCAGLTSLGCTSGTTLVAPAGGVTSGTTYYIRVSTTDLTSAVTSGTYTFKIAVANPGTTLTATQTTTPTTVSPVVDYGKSYINITKGINGGTTEPGDVLEIRATFVVKGTTTGTAYNISFTDNVPANTTYIASSLKTITNEGKTYQSFGDGTGDNDGGTNSGTAITINMGVGATASSGGFLSYRSKPSFYNSSCIIVAAYRVKVNSAATYGTKVPVGRGTISYNDYTGTVTSKTFAADTIMLYPNYGICSNTVGTNAITSEFGGTFGSGKAKNRTPSSKIPSNYIDTIFTNNSPQDYYYGITNNTSAAGTGYSTLNTWAYPDNSVTPNSHRLFSMEDIIGDHTNAVSPTLGNPPADTVNSSTGGYMAFINAAYRTDTAFLDTIRNLCPNTYYQYSAWFRNMCPKCGCDSNGVGATGTGYIPTAANDSSGVYPNLTFNINGYDYYTTGNILHTGLWAQKGFTYLADSNTTSLIINVRNNAPGGGGNDWVIDDIGVATCSPNVALTPNRPDTLCMGNDDTVRFKVSSFFNSYTHYQLQKSINGGITWTSPGADTTGAADIGTGTPVYNSGTGNYEYVATRYYQLNITDTLTTYRLIVATTTGNLSNSNCSAFATAQKIVVTANCFGVLATNIILFKGRLDNDYGKLQWIISNETPNTTYLIQRSTDQIHYEDIGTLFGTAEDGMNATYNFTDPKEISQPTYYRISIVSGGYRKYSNIVLLSNTDINFDVQSVTSPFNDWLAFDMTAPDNALSTFTIIDMYGRAVAQQKQNVNKGINDIKMYNLGSLSSGTYTLQVHYNGELINKRVIKLMQ